VVESSEERRGEREARRELVVFDEGLFSLGESGLAVGRFWMRGD
jgi:hypothetical protein